MKVSFRVTRMRAVVSVVLAVLAVASGVAYSAITDQGALITACMQKNLGTIRMYDASAPSTSALSKPCNATLGEVAISWNQQGIQGIEGIQGPKGDKGDTGGKGDKGDQGIQGIQGPKGDTGAAGAAGAAGPAGPTGPAGVSGYQIATSIVSIPTGTGIGWFDGTAQCATGKVAIGGGVQTGQFDFREYDDNILDSFPSNSGTAWTGRVYSGGFPHNIVVYAICANAS